jgi:hypothetical protein
MEKYGFVYIWFDRKHKRYYIGCHWGNVTDGYICSSSNMKSAYKRRPEDFKRKIIKKIYSSKKDLLEEEFKWLSKIKPEELGNRYYNLHNHHYSHWSTCEASTLSLKQKLSASAKKNAQDPAYRAKYLEGLKTRDNRSSDLIVRQKRRESMIGKNTGKDNSKARELAVAANRGRKLSEEHKQKIKAAGAFKTLNNKKVSCVHCGTEGNVGNISRYHNDRCKNKKFECVGTLQCQY